jgi:hypothetical protein
VLAPAPLRARRLPDDGYAAATTAAAAAAVAITLARALLDTAGGKSGRRSVGATSSMSATCHTYLVGRVTSVGLSLVGRVLNGALFRVMQLNTSSAHPERTPRRALNPSDDCRDSASTSH